MTMKPKHNSILLSILLVALILAGCGPAGSAASGGVSAWIDQPVTSALLPLTPFTLRAHASRAGGGIIKIVFLVNDNQVASVNTDASASIVQAETQWGTSNPGVYVIQAQAFTAQGSNLSETSTVCVSADIRQPILGFGGDCGGPMPILPQAGQPPLSVTITQLPQANISPTPSQTATASKSEFLFTPKVNAYCRSGPDLSFPSLQVAMAGQTYLMDGRNLDSTWFRIMFSATQGCWVLASSGTPSTDPSGLRVLADVPTVVPTVVPTDTPAPFDCFAAYGSLQSSCEADARCTYVAKACTNK
jgi:hypothetical protein